MGEGGTEQRELARGAAPPGPGRGGSGSRVRQRVPAASPRVTHQSRGPGGDSLWPARPSLTSGPAGGTGPARPGQMPGDPSQLRPCSKRAQDTDGPGVASSLPAATCPCLQTAWLRPTAPQRGLPFSPPRAPRGVCVLCPAGAPGTLGTRVSGPLWSGVAPFSS